MSTAPDDAPEPPLDEETRARLDLRRRSALVRAALRGAPREQRKTTGLVLLVGVVLFAFALGAKTVTHAAVVVGVIAVHELGHLVAMKLFGYRDLRIFFIPFFGGIAQGRKLAAPARQRAIVLLAGPVPGLVAGGALYFVSLGHPLVRDVATMLLVINAFNLLPLVPLDGGRLLELVVARAHPLISIGTTVLTSAALGAISFATASYGLGVVTVIVLMSTPSRFQLARSAASLRKRFGALPAEPDALTDDVVIALDDEAQRLRGGNEVQQRAMVRSLFEDLATTPLGGPGRAAVGSIWVVPMVALLGAVPWGMFMGDHYLRLTDARRLVPLDPAAARGELVELCNEPARPFDFECASLAAALAEADDDDDAAQAQLEADASAPFVPVDVLVQLANIEERGRTVENHAALHRLRAEEMEQRIAEMKKRISADDSGR